MQITLGSGDSDTFNFDANTGSMKQYQFNVNGQAVTGNLSWNQNGSLGSLQITDPFNSANQQICNYSHDDLARIASANCGSAAAQTFTYDAFGNFNKSGSPYSFSASYSSATNHITCIAGSGQYCAGGTIPTYDANGNVTQDSLDSYTWDAVCARTMPGGPQILAGRVPLGFPNSCPLPPPLPMQMPSPPMQGVLLSYITMVERVQFGPSPADKLPTAQEFTQVLSSYPSLNPQVQALDEGTHCAGLAGVNAYWAADCAHSLLMNIGRLTGVPGTGWGPPPGSAGGGWADRCWTSFTDGECSGGTGPGGEFLSCKKDEGTGEVICVPIKN
jgi:hypothetical protein